MSDAISGIGAKYKRGDGQSNEIFSAIAEVSNIGGPDKSRDTIDVTSLDSTDGYREFIAGFRDGGEVTLNMNFTRDGYISMDADYLSDDLVNYQIVFPDTGETTFDFAALVTNITNVIPTDDKISMDVTLKISGPVTTSS